MTSSEGDFVVFSSEDDEDDDMVPSTSGCVEENAQNSETKVELLEYERNLMLDTLSDDVLFIVARGLGLERLILHHLHLYSDPSLLVFVINTNNHDEIYFISHLKANNATCLPKIINSDLSIKDRETLYNEGGVHFITSRILMVDLLQNRISPQRISGIVVHRAHQLLGGFQESFILRLFREKKKDGFVKAFSDNPAAFTSLGSVQRIINRLYIRRVRLLPRFDVDVKRDLDSHPPVMVEMVIDLPHPMRKVQSSLVDIIRTCVKELKQSSTVVDLSTEEECNHPSVGLNPSPLEVQFKGKNLSLSEKQQRLLNDLAQLRTLLQQAENMDAATLYQSLTSVRNEKNLLINNSGWLFTQTASKLCIEVEKMFKIKENNGFTIFESPKWIGLKNVLEEIRNKNKIVQNSDSPVILITDGIENARFLRDLIVFGIKKFKWFKRSKVVEETTSFADASDEPEAEPFWDPTRATLYASKVEGEDRTNVISDVQNAQKEIARRRRKRRLIADKKGFSKTLIEPGQKRLIQFGIVQYKRGEEVDIKTELPESEHLDLVDVRSSEDPTLLILPHGERYNFLRQLKQNKPNFIILYHSDLVTLRLIEIHKASYPEQEMYIYILMFKESNEEERYLYSLRSEQCAFEQLVREQQTVMVPSQYDTSREAPPKLQLSKSIRVEENNDEECPRVIVDMREFNSELPTILYKRGTELMPATLEVGDYILSPNTAVERKSLDDLAQSLYSGRVFKQIEQMLQHYKNVILLIESSVKDTYRKAAGGPFQGELTRRCRETRGLFTILVRTYPLMNIVWTMDPIHSAEMFEEFKFNQPNPVIADAVANRNDVHEGGNQDSQDAKDSTNVPSTKRFNSVLQRQLKRLPNLSINDISSMMSSDKVTCLLDVINSDLDTLSTIFGSTEQALSLQMFFKSSFNR